MSSYAQAAVPTPPLQITSLILILITTMSRQLMMMSIICRTPSNPGPSHTITTRSSSTDTNLTSSRVSGDIQYVGRSELCATGRYQGGFSRTTPQARSGYVSAGASCWDSDITTQQFLREGCHAVSCLRLLSFWGFVLGCSGREHLY
jgi:hypothetical protein